MTEEPEAEWLDATGVLHRGGRFSPPVSVSKPELFDPRTEVSADAKYVAGRIVKHLWIIFVLLPFVLGLAYALLYEALR